MTVQPAPVIIEPGLQFIAVANPDCIYLITSKECDSDGDTWFWVEWTADGKRDSWAVQDIDADSFFKTGSWKEIGRVVLVDLSKEIKRKSLRYWLNRFFR